MSTLALNKLLEYILSLSLTNKNKDWHGDECAEDIIAVINEGKGIKEPLSL